MTTSSPPKKKMGPEPESVPENILPNSKGSGGSTLVAQLHPLGTTFAYYLAFISMGLYGGLTGLALPFLAANTHSRVAQISLIFVASSFGYLIGSLFTGKLYDRYPGNRILSSVLIVVASMWILIPVVPLLWMLVLVLFLMGMANNGMDVGCNSMLVWLHGSKVGPFINGLHFFFGVGAFVAPLVAAQVIRVTGGVTYVYWLFAVFAIFCAIVVWNLPSPSAHAYLHDSASRTTTPILLILLFGSLFLFHAGSQVGFGSWLYSYATRMGLTDPATAAYLTSAFWGVFTVSRLLAIGISTRVRPKTIIFVDLFGCLASLAVMIVFPGSLAALWIGVIGLGLFMASIYPSTMAFAGQRMHLTATVTSKILIGGGIGGMLIPWLIGQLFEPIGPTVTMVIIAIGMTAHLGVMIWLTLPKGRPGPEQPSLVPLAS